MAQHAHVTFTECLGVTVSNLEITALSASRNTDGLQLSSSHDIDVSYCKIGTGDDCVSILSNSSKIVVGDISCGPSIGSLGKSSSWSQVQDAVIQNSILSETGFESRIRSWLGGSGFAKDIIFHDEDMENVSHPIIIDPYCCGSFVPSFNQNSSVKVANISFVNIKGTSASALVMKFACSIDSLCEGLYHADFNLES